MKNKRPRVDGSPKVKTIKVQLSPGIHKRLERLSRDQAGGLKGNVAAMVRQWIIDRLPEEEQKMFPRPIPESPTGQAKKKQEGGLARESV